MTSPRWFDRAGDAAAGRPCGVCRRAITANEPVALIPVAPANDEARAAMRSGKTYNARATMVCERCGLRYQKR